MKTFLVGGAVRDEALGLPVTERDWVVVGATIDAMLQSGFQAVGKDFPVFLHPQTHEEYALARQERKSGKGYTGFTCISDPSVTLEEDLLRRDLTVNAIAKDEYGNFIDPYNGLEDLENRILRHVSPAFSEDPLRVLRVARFAAKLHPLGFTIATETLTLMKNMSDSGELSELTPERVWKEIEKSLATASPHIFFQVLHDCGALAVLIPEMDILFGIPQPAQHHPEIDTGLHTLLVIEQAAQLSNDVCVRFAAAMHDLGKGITPASDWPRHIGHEFSGVKLVKNVCQRLRIPNECRDLALLVCEQHLNCHRALDMKPATIQKLFTNLDAYRRPERVPLFLRACEADARGRLGLENSPYPQASYLTACFAAASAIQARNLDIDNLEGKAVGQLVNKHRINAIADVKKTWLSA